MSKQKIYFDSCCFIDIVANDANIKTKEQRDYDVECYKSLFQESKANNIIAFTSYLTVVECTHVKDKNKKTILTNEVKRLFDSIILSGMAGITTIMPTSIIIERARQLNWDNNITLKPFDLLHVSSALELNCCEFITTDVNSINRDDNILKIKKLGLGIIKVTSSSFLPADHLQTELTLNE